MGTPAGKSTDILAHAFFSAQDATLANGADLDVLVRVGSLAINAGIAVAVSGNYDVFLFENPTVTSPGTPELIFDLKRPRKVTPETTIFTAPTLSSDGILLTGPIFVPGGSVVGQAPGIGAFVTQEARIEMTPTEDYLLRFTNTSGGSARVNPQLNFVELPS